MSANGTQQDSPIRAARKALKLSQQDVASRAGCSVSYVRVLESGYQPAHGSGVLARIKAVLDEPPPGEDPGR
jgi:transcriptional regulator with XRE-family HTH domain